MSIAPLLNKIGYERSNSLVPSVIPQDVRAKMNLKPRQKVIVVEKDGVVRLIPEKPMKEMRGFVKGVTTDKLRCEEDRF